MAERNGFERDLMRSETSVDAAREAQEEMRRIDRREWWLWSYALIVTLLLMLAIASFTLPAILPEGDRFHSFMLSQAVRGLAALVLLFNVYVVFQQVQIHRIRRQLTSQVFAVEKVEMLAQEVYKLAILDTLTGLFNRRYIDHRLADEITRSRRYGRPLTVILFDLNDFKKVNDRHGHAGGDTVLKLFAERLSKSTRGSDVAARFGGDEFLVLLPECRPEDVQHILRRLDGFIADVGGEALNVSFSAGWANYVADETSEDLLKRADAALYTNKRGTRESLESSKVVA